MRRTTDQRHKTPDAPCCIVCGGEVPLLQALVYHGNVYHPRCVAFLGVTQGEDDTRVAAKGEQA